MYPIQIEQILTTLSDLGVSRGDNVLIHSSFRSIFKGSQSPNCMNYSSSSYARDLIDEIKNLLNNGSILIPTEFAGDYHMESFEKRIYSPKNEKTNRGYLTESFLNRHDTKRSLHPIYNVSVLGEGFDDAIANHHTKPFSMSEGSPWYQFAESGGKIIFIGVGLEANSMLHLPEYDLGLQYPRPVFFHKPHTFQIQNQKAVLEVSAYVHAIRWKPKTAPAFMTYLNEKYKFIQHRKIENTVITVIDAAKQRELLMKELSNGVSWYDAIGW